jgi:hypothetical protein
VSDVIIELVSEVLTILAHEELYLLIYNAM